MRNHLIVGAAAFIGLAASRPAWSQEELRAEKHQLGQERANVLRSLLTGPDKIWEARADFSAVFDRNINRLLVNSAVPANPPLPDTAWHTAAGFSLTPSWGRKLKTEFSYDYDRFDYRRHAAFSYYAHSVAADFYPRLTSKLSLQVGGYFESTGDQTGKIANDQAAHLGIVWSAPYKVRVKAGYEIRKDIVLPNPLRDANSNIYYLSAFHVFPLHQTGFLSYRFRATSASGGDFSYHLHSLRAGLISHWTAGFKTTVIGSYGDAPYEHTDSRFLQTRHDQTYGIVIKPAVALSQWVDAVGSFTYLQNRSNVVIKRYSDQIYSLGLEGRF